MKLNMNKIKKELKNVELKELREYYNNILLNYEIRIDEYDELIDIIECHIDYLIKNNYGSEINNFILDVILQE